MIWSIERDAVPEEGRAAFDRLLAEGDSNQDGKFEADEFRALALKLHALTQGEAGLAAQRFKNGDSTISKAEFKGRQALFDRLDTDNDGALSKR